jgi:hypothetical protein
MLAGAEEEFCAEWEARAFDQKMSVIANLLDGLIDYAGLYPPASLDLPAAARNYLSYRQGKDAASLGRLVVDLNRVEELRSVTGDSLQEFHLSVTSSASPDVDSLIRFLDAGLPIEAIEIKADTASAIEHIARQLPVGVIAYFEVPVKDTDAAVLDAIDAAGARVKLRLGGVTAEAFPTSLPIARMLQAIADRRLLFKATAGLHHPLRGRYPFTDAPDSAVGTMHGFLNLSCAAALLHLGGDVTDAMRILDEMDRNAWQISRDSIAWRHLSWSALQIGEIRKGFFCSIGSCSFTQPLAEMEALGWR